MIKLFSIKTGNTKTISKEFARSILSMYLNVDGNDLVIFENNYGKPYLRDYPNVHYNISHTRGVIVCALSDKPVGVDIEKVKSFNSRIVGRFYTKNEQDYVYATQDGQEDRFTEIWSKKEAYVKWLGLGLAMHFDSFDVLSIKDEAIFITQLSNDNYISVCTFQSYDK